MRIEDVKQWQCGNGLAVAVNPYGYYEHSKTGATGFNDKLTSNFDDYHRWANNPANQPVTDLSGIYNSEQVKEVLEILGTRGKWSRLRDEEVLLYKYSNATTRRRLVLEAALCNTDGSPEVIVSKIESPAQITIGDTSFTKLTDGFIQILTKNGCVELVPEEIEELYKFIK